MNGEAPTIVDGSGKIRLMTLADLDRRTGAAYRAHTMVKAITEDLGGETRLATAEKQIIQRAALLGTLAEDLEARWLLGQQIDIGTLCALGNAQRRALEAVGLRRVARDVTRLSTYLANTTAEEAAQ
jgi:DNA-binding helix-hairpin-helix protein with protein kinase domain